MLRSLATLALAAAAVAQAGERLRSVRPELHATAGAGTTVFAALFHHGLDHDDPAECGAARVLAQCRLERARRAAGATTASGAHVGNDVAAVFVEVDGADWRRGATFVRALLDPDEPLDDDAIRLAIARAALVADDAEWLYPGPVLASRARAALFSDRRGRGAAGSASALQRLTAARVRELLARPVAVDVAVFGEVPAAARDLEFEVRAPARPAAEASRSRTAARTTRPGSEPELIRHPRVDAAFAAVAFAAPPGAGAEFAVAVEVARERARARLPRRLAGLHAYARAPALSWSWLDGDPAVLFCRRGHDGDEPAAVFAELDALLDDLRQRPPTARELERARRSLLLETAPLPWQPVPTAPGRVVVAMRARHRGITRAAIAAVTADSAQAALRGTIGPDRASERSWRGALVPSAPRPDPLRRR